MGCFSIPMGRDDEAIAFVFRRDGLETNIKFRTLKEKGYFFATSGALMHPYNADAIGKHTTLIITEGEMDSIACLCAELPNTTGVPNGAGSKNMAWIDTYAEEMAKVERFYIAADDDARGHELRQALIDKLGAERCHIVTYNGYKDANELLQNEGKEALKAQLQKASQPEIEHIINLSNELDSFEKFFTDGGMKGLKIDMPEIDEIVSWRPGSFIVVTGIPGHGKSEFIDFLVVSLNRLHGFKTLFFSPENDPVTYHMSKLSMKITGKRFGTPYMTHEEMSTVYTDIKQNFFFIEPDLFDIDQILELAAVMVKMHGIKVFVVDPFNTLELKNPENISETNVINRLLGKFKAFVRNYNVSLILSAHPRKMDLLGKSDVANHR
ncbi:MAG: toprim domain-containing protein [Tannerellaceae bacterium]